MTITRFIFTSKTFANKPTVTIEAPSSVVKGSKITIKINVEHNIHVYEKVVESLSDYNRTIEMGLQILLRTRPEAVDFLTPEPTNRLGAVVFGSDQGMCGQLNDQIVSYAAEMMDKIGVEPKKRTLLAVGLRVSGQLEAAGHTAQESLSIPGSTAGITPMVQEIVMLIEKWHFSQRIDRIVLFFNMHLSGASYRPHMHSLLPIDVAWLKGLAKKKWPTRMLPTFTMGWNELLSRLIRQHLFASLYRALAESLTSENASRLASMQGAERNIEERLGEFNSQFRQQRQMVITEELLDIVSGFMALEGDDTNA